MKEMMQKLREAALQAILETEDVDSLENLRVKYLGKKGELTGILRQMGKLTAEERPQMGQLANQLRSELEETLETRRTALNEARLEMKLLQETVDVTLPGKKQPQGHKHPMYNVLDQIKDIFIGMGFEIVDGPEVELSDYNFTKLNIDSSTAMWVPWPLSPLPWSRWPSRSAISSVQRCAKWRKPSARVRRAPAPCRTSATPSPPRISAGARA